ncbi:tetratricopeptide repeat protein [Streptomyces sp. NTK 937]|uniref:tetratricopeptide repeat protein n=1 Tax=Streptomyces sp. NTK 937 TaxID=1487711 RepID=UPI0012FEB980|nr:tetratricopeptide repeat protein [Streptomyces sp. NTK 937]
MSMLAKDIADRPTSAHLIMQRLAPTPRRRTPIHNPPTTKATRATPPPPSPVAARQLPATARIVQAQALLDAGHFGEALPVYNALSAELAAADYNPRQAAECRANAAFCHLRLGNLEQALAEYTALAADLNQDAPSEDALLLEARSESACCKQPPIGQRKHSLPSSGSIPSLPNTLAMTTL